MAKQNPSVNFTALHPGSIVSSFGATLGFAGILYYFMVSTCSNVRRAAKEQDALRAAPLEPDFNTTDALQGADLHCDGNPCPKEKLSTDPETKKPMEWDKHAEKVVKLLAKNELIEKLL